MSSERTKSRPATEIQETTTTDGGIRSEHLGARGKEKKKRGARAPGAGKAWRRHDGREGKKGKTAGSVHVESATGVPSRVQPPEKKGGKMRTKMVASRQEKETG